eukprot:6157681-Pleurochrysis_carterae.AAC.1
MGFQVALLHGGWGSPFCGCLGHHPVFVVDGVRFLVATRGFPLLLLLAARVCIVAPRLSRARAQARRAAQLAPRPDKGAVDAASVSSDDEGDKVTYEEFTRRVGQIYVEEDKALICPWARTCLGANLPWGEPALG